MNRFLRSLKLALVLGPIASLAGPIVERVSVTIHSGDQREVKNFLVLSKTEPVSEGPRQNQKQTYTLVEINKHSEHPQHTIATTSELTLTFSPTANDRYRLSSLSGKLPSHGEILVEQLNTPIHSEEVKPKGTLLSYSCGTNILEGNRIVGQVCLQSANSVSP